MGNLIGIFKNNFNIINFEKMLDCIYDDEFLIINTIDNDNQNCLIINTIDYLKEENILNKFISTNLNKKIIIYGKNSSDKSVFEKYQQLYKLGFKNIQIYLGGLFEWLLLQDIYGNDVFKTTSNILDILQYK